MGSREGLMEIVLGQRGRKDTQSVVLTALVISLVASGAASWLLSKSKAKRDEYGNVLDPVGGNRLKNAIGIIMALIARFRERQSTSKATLQQLEAFHKPEAHDFFNESYYFSGCEKNSKDRLISRISRRGAGGEKSYVFMLLDIDGVGPLSLEEDNVPVSEEAKASGLPSALGVNYECIEPMQKWRVTYSGKMRRGCPTPDQAKNLKTDDLVQVELDLIYERQTPVFYYIRDDCPETLAKNLSQEPWGLQFLKVCLKRNKNHGHYEDFGSLHGKISVDQGPSREFDFATFRDHSWDIRRWQTMDSLLILLIALEEPLRLFGHDYWFLDMTLVSMPGNESGVARYSTGYMLPRQDLDAKAPVLCLTHGTSIDDIPWKSMPDGTRQPMPVTDVVMYVRPEPTRSSEDSASVPVRIKMSGDVRRLMYYPDNNQFQCFEDCLDFQITNLVSKQTTKGYGTRQSGFRHGDFDPSLGGCG